MTLDEYNNLKIGDKLFRLTNYGIIEYEIVGAEEFDNRFGKKCEYRLNDGSKLPIVYRGSITYFLTREEAEKTKELKEKNIIKKKKLYEYEKELNKELGIETFLIKFS